MRNPFGLFGGLKLVVARTRLAQIILAAQALSIAALLAMSFLGIRLGLGRSTTQETVYGHRLNRRPRKTARSAKPLFFLVSPAGFEPATR